MEYLSYILPFLAIFIGYFVAIWFLSSDSRLGYLLSFSGAFLLAITLLEMLPSLFTKGNDRVGIWIMIGVLLQIILDFFSRGAEHGHIHFSENRQMTFPYFLLCSLCIHAFIEGFPLVSNNHVLIGVAVHKIPIAAVITLFMLKAKYPKGTTLLYLLLFALMTPLGSLVSTTEIFPSHILTSINAIAAGIFLHVSTTILFESSKDHSFNLYKLLTIILGILIAFII